jgi:molecular chaperone DnaK
VSRIGIDLGTTNSAAAYTPDGRNPRVITIGTEQLVPSVVVRRQDGSTLVGAPAKRSAAQDPRSAIFSIKRLMGRRYDDPEVERVRRHVNYQIVGSKGPGQKMAHVMLGDEEVSPIGISALILQWIKSECDKVLPEPVTHAVVTVPAYFDDNQREATRQAAGEAGLKVSRILDEPTAAAYAFGMDLDPDSARTVLVYDLGGGTFDVSIIYIADGIPIVQHIKGDNWLGGDNFDHMIMDYVMEQVAKEGRATVEEMRADAGFMLTLKGLCEAAKWELGQAPSADVITYGALGGKLRVEVRVQRTDFESWIRPKIEESIDLVEEAMAKPGLSPEDIDHVLLVGGSTAIPLVGDVLAAKFGWGKIRSSMDRMVCVAQGAGIVASRTLVKVCHRQLCGRENEPDAVKCINPDCRADLRDAKPQVKCPHCGDLHPQEAVTCPRTGRPMVGGEGGVTAKPYGIGAHDGSFEVIIKESTPYPTAKPEFATFHTVRDYQERIMFPIYQGFDPVAANNEWQCTIVIPSQHETIPEGKRVPRHTPLDVGFSLDNNGTLTVKVRGKGALSWLQREELVRPWEQQISVTGEVCPRCQHDNAAGAAVCGRCGESLVPGRGPGPDGGEPEWKSDLGFWITVALTVINEYDWLLKIVAPAKLDALRSLTDQAVQACDKDDESAGRALKPQLEAAVHDATTGFRDLAWGSVVALHSKGDEAEKLRLANMLQEWKRRVTAGEDVNSPGLSQLRDQIKALADEIMDKIGTVECPHCHQRTRSRGRCESCGKDLVWSRDGVER